VLNRRLRVFQLHGSMSAIVSGICCNECPILADSGVFTQDCLLHDGLTDAYDNIHMVS